METLTFLLRHMCLYLRLFPLFFQLIRRKSTWKTRKTGKPLESVIQLKMSEPPPPLPHHRHIWNPSSSSLTSCLTRNGREERRWYNSASWPTRPTEVERIRCPAGEHVNIERGEKTSYKQLSHHPTIPNPPSSLISHLHMERWRKGNRRSSGVKWGGGEQKC